MPDTETNTNPPADAPEADTPTALSPEDLRRELESTRKEAAKYRTRLREREEADKAKDEAKRQAELTAEQRAKEAEERATAALAAAEARILTAERKAALAGKVANADRVLRLMDDADTYFDGSTPNVDAILADFPEYAVNTDGVQIPNARSESIPDRLRPDDFKGKSPAWIEQNLHRLKPPT
jgi:hypothetical protein